MDAVLTSLFNAWDGMGLELTWLFLGLAFSVGPLAMLFTAILNPKHLSSFSALRKATFATMWKLLAGPLDERYAALKKPLLREASGVVIDVGSGIGNNLKYLDPARISRLYLIEPNPGMHTLLAANARKAGFADDQFQIVACGAEDRERVEELTGLTGGSCDSVVSVFALCGIPRSRETIAALYEYLKPGGVFFFFEHVASKIASKRKTQDRLNPVWSTIFDGCQLDRPTDKWIIESFEWADQKTFEVDFESPTDTLPKSYGWARKR